MAIFWRMSPLLVSLSQSRLGGNGVRPASTRRRAPRSASQVAISRPSAPMPPVMRYAASGRHRNGSRTRWPETGTNARMKNSPSRSATMDLDAVGSTVDSADAQSPMSSPTGRSTRPPHSCGCSAPMTEASPHRQLWRNALSEAASRTPRVMIHSVAGWWSSRSARRRTRSPTSADKRTAQSISSSVVVHQTGLG